jgi:hypothetical protein
MKWKVNEVESMKKEVFFALFLHFSKSRKDAHYLSLYSKLHRIEERKNGKDKRVYKGGTEIGGKKNVEIKE